ncbi:uncharacterized protein LOC144138078 [Haemaphysalis longicornis]
MKVFVVIATLAFVAQVSLAQDGQEVESSLPRRHVFPPVKWPRPWEPRPWPRPWPRPLPMPLPQPQPRIVAYTGLDVDTPDDEEPSKRQHRPDRLPKPWIRPRPKPRPYP